MLPLKAGDSIDIVAPSSRVDAALLPKIAQLCEMWGFKANINSDIFGDDKFYANSDDKRLQQFVAACTNPNSRALWCVRGGVGAANLIPQLQKIPVPATPKLLIGLSDITALHLFITQNWRWPTLHAHVAKQAALEPDSDSTVKIKQLLTENNAIAKIDNIKPLNAAASRIKRIEADVTGGNLTLLTTSIGTNWQLQAAGKIVLIEEIDERGYRIERAFTHLLQAKVLQSAAAIVLADFLGGNEPNGENYTTLALERFAASQNLPVFKANGIGHGSTNNPVFFGTNSYLAQNGNNNFQLSTMLR